MQGAAPALSQPVFNSPVLLIENRRTLFFVELEDIVRGQTKAEPDGDDAAS